MYTYISVYIIRGNPLYIHDTSPAGLKTASCIIHAGTYSSRISNRKRKQFKNHCNYHDSPSLPYLCTLWNERNSFFNIYKKRKKKKVYSNPLSNNNTLTLQRYSSSPDSFSILSFLSSRTISFWGKNFLFDGQKCNRNTKYVL